MDIAGTTLTAEDKHYLQHPQVGGLILFARNYQHRQQLMALTAAVREFRPDIIIAVDHEGGRVQRFKTGFTRIPAMGQFGKLYDDNPYLAKQAVTAVAYLLASELIAVGIDVNLGPVLDIDYGRCAAIGNRAFHRHPAVVATLALHYQQGLRAAGMAAVAKHFPGHGYVEADSHVASPRDARDASTLLHNDILPFVELIAADCAAIMPSHVVYTKIDQQIANFSEKWLKKILRQRLGFQGLLISDDLHMQAATNVGKMPARVWAALRAGCDVVLVCNDRLGLIQSCHRCETSSALDLSPLRAKPQLHKQHDEWIACANYWSKRLG